MGAEILLYCYGAVCFGMLIFNVIYVMSLKTDDRKFSERLNMIREHMDDSGWMKKKLSNVNYLIAFDRFLDGYSLKSEEYGAYMRRFKDVLMHLAVVYRKREDTQAAYFCHFTASHSFGRYMELDNIQRIILSYLEKSSLYCRINAFKALCSFGKPEIIVEALRKLENGKRTQLHEKVIVEAMLTYAGDTEELIEKFWNAFDSFSLQAEMAIMDYIRFKDGGCGAQMEKILRDSKRNKELRLGAIRYFGRYKDYGVLDILLDFVKDKDPLNWEYSAISASALSGYSSDEVVSALVQAMSSPNWYIRYNASASLEAHGLSYEEMLGVLHGNDRYAREMLVYRLESKKLANEAKAEEQRKKKVAANL